MAAGPGRLFDEKGADLGGELRELRLVEAAEVGWRVDRLERSATVFLTRLPGNVLRSRDQHAPSMAGGPLGQVLRHQLQDVRDPKIHASLASRGGDVHQAARVV